MRTAHSSSRLSATRCSTLPASPSNNGNCAPASLLPAIERSRLTPGQRFLNWRDLRPPKVASRRAAMSARTRHPFHELPWSPRVISRTNRVSGARPACIARFRPQPCLIRAHKPIIVGVAADPNPRHRARTQAPERAIVIPDPHRESILSALQSPKEKRGMIGLTATNGSSSPLMPGFRVEEHGRDPRTVACRPSSFRRRPLAKKPPFGFVFGLLKQEIELARNGVAIQLFVPPLPIAKPKPLGNAAEFFRRQAFNCGFDLLYPVHASSLHGNSPARPGRGLALPGTSSEAPCLLPLNLTMGGQLWL